MLRSLLQTAFVIPNSEPARIACPDGREIILCDAGSAAWHEPLPTVSIHTPWLAWQPAQVVIRARHAHARVPLLVLALWDNPGASLEPHLTLATEFMRQHRRVLVHCRMGRSRSAAVVVGFLMREYGLSFADALARVRDTRPIVRINPGFTAQLLAAQ